MNYSNLPTNAPTTHSSVRRPINYSSSHSSNQGRLPMVQNHERSQSLFTHSDPGFLFRSPASTQGFLSSLRPLAVRPLMRSHSAPLEYQPNQATIHEHGETPIDFTSNEQNINRIEECSIADIIGLEEDFRDGKFGFLKAAVEHGLLASESKMYLQQRCEENHLNHFLEPLIIALAKAKNDGQYSNVMDLISKGRHAQLTGLIKRGLVSRENCLALKMYCMKNSHIIQNVLVHAEISQYYFK